MRKGRLLQPALLEVIAAAGHGQAIVVADAGLPIPPETPRIDLALVSGIPTFGQVLQAVVAEMAVERVVIAEEADRSGEELRRTLNEAFAGAGDPTPEIEVVGHEELKARCRTALAVVRSGEQTPYFNAILVAGVTF